MDLFKKIEYNSETTILRCNKCKHENIEWYNDQPGDICLKDGCKGHYIREYKKIK